MKSKLTRKKNHRTKEWEYFLNGVKIGGRDEIDFHWEIQTEKKKYICAGKAQARYLCLRDELLVSVGGMSGCGIIVGEFSIRQRFPLVQLEGLRPFVGCFVRTYVGGVM